MKYTHMPNLMLNLMIFLFWILFGNFRNLKKLNEYAIFKKYKKFDWHFQTEDSKNNFYSEKYFNFKNPVNVHVLWVMKIIFRHNHIKNSEYKNSPFLESSCIS